MAQERVPIAKQEPYIVNIEHKPCCELRQPARFEFGSSARQPPALQPWESQPYITTLQPTGLQVYKGSRCEALVAHAITEVVYLYFVVYCLVSVALRIVRLLVYFA